MTKTYFPFDAGVGADSYEDRWEKMARKFRQDGVFLGELNDLELYADDTGMQVKVRSGQSWLNGFFFESDATETLAITTADPTNDRIDRVAVKLDTGANTVDLVVVTGTPAGSPTPPTLTDTATVKYLSLGQVLVDAAASSILAGKITDERTYSYSDVEVTPGGLNLADGGELTISTGAVTVSPSSGEGFYQIDTESDASTDDLATINGGADGDVIVIRPENDAREVVLVETGNIQLPDDESIYLFDIEHYVILRYELSLTKWVVIGGVYPTPFTWNIPFGDGVNDPATGVWDYYRLGYSGVIRGHELTAPASSTVQIDAWLDTYANYPPTDADSIFSGSEPALSAGTKDQDLTWNIVFNKGDYLGINIDSLSAGANHFNLAIFGYKTP